MADDPLNRARRQLLASTDQLLTQLDEAALGDSFRAISPGLGAARQKAREKAIDVVTSRARALLVDKIGADLGWELLDRSRWVGSEAAAIYASRLSSVADFLTNAQAAGRDSKELMLWTRYWQHQIAGSDVHKVARAANLAIAGDTPVMGRYERIAEPRACAWCRGLATRGAVYYERGTAAASGHAHCRCEVVAVTDPSMIAETRKAGAEAWDQSNLSRGENPFRGRSGGKGGPPPMDPALTRPGALTVERRIAVEAQLRSYQGAIEAGGGNDWMRAKMLELADELDELNRRGIGTPAPELPRLVPPKPPTPAAPTVTTVAEPTTATIDEAIAAAKPPAGFVEIDVENIGDAWENDPFLADYLGQMGRMQMYRDRKFAENRFFYDPDRNVGVVINRKYATNDTVVARFNEVAGRAVTKAADNLPPERRAVTTVFELNGKAKGRTNAQTFLSGRTIEVNRNQLALTDPKKAAKAAKEGLAGKHWSVSGRAEDPVLNTLVHELGHNADRARAIPAGSPARAEWSMRKARLYKKWVGAEIPDAQTEGAVLRLARSTRITASDAELLKKVTDGPTLYGRSHEDEMFAEAFAAWTLRDIAPMPPAMYRWAKDFAEEFGWL